MFSYIHSKGYYYTLNSFGILKVGEPTEPDSHLTVKIAFGILAIIYSVIFVYSLLK